MLKICVLYLLSLEVIFNVFSIITYLLYIHNVNICNFKFFDTFSDVHICYLLKYFFVELSCTFLSYSWVMYLLDSVVNK